MIRIRKFPKTNCISLFFPKLGDFGSHDSSTVGIGPGTFPRAWLSAGRLSLASLGRCGFVLRKCCKGGELTRRDYFANPFIIYVIFIYLILYNIIHIYIYIYNSNSRDITDYYLSTIYINEHGVVRHSPALYRSMTWSAAGSLSPGYNVHVSGIRKPRIGNTKLIKVLDLVL